MKLTNSILFFVVLLIAAACGDSADEPEGLVIEAPDSVLDTIDRTDGSPSNAAPSETNPSDRDPSSAAPNESKETTETETEPKRYTVFPGPCSEKNRYLRDYENDVPNWLSEVYYAYDSSDRLVEERKWITGTERWRHDYFYDQNVPDRVYQKHSTHVESGHTNVTQYNYDAQGRLEYELEDLNGDLHPDKMKQYVYSDGLVEIFIFKDDGDNELDLYTVQTIDDEGKLTYEETFDVDSSTERRFYWTYFSYDNEGRLVDEWFHHKYLSVPRHFIHTYDGYGNLIFEALTQGGPGGSTEQYLTEFDYSCWPQ